MSCETQARQEETPASREETPDSKEDVPNRQQKPPASQGKRQPVYFTGYAGWHTKSARQPTFGARCLVVELHEKAEDSDGLALDASPDSTEVDLQFTENAPSGVVTALLCHGREHQCFLSDANSRLRLQSALQGAGDVWRIIPVDQTCTFLITCPRKEVELFLAHYGGEV